MVEGKTTMNPFPDENLTRVLLVVLLVAAMIDLRTFRIPNLITMPFAVGALTYYGVLYGYSGLLFSLAGLGVGILLLFLPFVLGGLGGGDVKLLGMVGAFLGPKAVVSAFFFTAIVGGIYAVGVLLLHRQSFRNLFTTMRAELYEFILTRKISPGSDALRSGRPRLKYGLAIAFGTGLFIIAQANGYTF
jgi:prepilin peptidase CpaA